MLNQIQSNQPKSCKMRMGQIGIWLLVFFVFAMVLFALASYISHPIIAEYYLNPDYNTTTYMAYNVIYEHGSFFAWHIGTAPSFVPEIALMFLLTLFNKNAFINLLIYAVFQIACITILIPAIFKAATKSSVGLRLGVISVFVLLTTVVIKHTFSVYDDYAYITTLLAPGFHYGATILVFALIFLFLKILMNPKVYLKVIFFILLVISGLSDPFTYVYFTFPMIVTVSILWFFKQRSMKDYVVYLALLIISFLTSYTIYHILPIQYVQLSLKPSFSIVLVLYFIKTVLEFIGKNFVWGILWILFMFWAPYSIWQSFKNKQSSTQLIDYVVLLQFITVIVSTPLIILAVNQTFPISWQIYPSTSFWSSPSKFYNELAFLPYRYFINFLIGPVFLGYPLLLYKHYKGIVEKLNTNYIYAIILVIFACTIFMFRAHHFYKDTFLHFHSKLAVCLDNYAKEYKLTNGVSDNYAVTNVVNAFTQRGIHIALVARNTLSPIRWQNTQQLYQYQNYNFVVTDSNLMGLTVIHTYGKPSHKFFCYDESNGRYTLYIYQNGKMNNIFNR